MRRQCTCNNLVPQRFKQIYAALKQADLSDVPYVVDTHACGDAAADNMPTINSPLNSRAARLGHGPPLQLPARSSALQCTAGIKQHFLHLAVAYDCCCCCCNCGPAAADHCTRCLLHCCCCHCCCLLSRPQVSAALLLVATAVVTAAHPRAAAAAALYCPQHPLQPQLGCRYLKLLLSPPCLTQSVTADAPRVPPPAPAAAQQRQQPR